MALPSSPAHRLQSCIAVGGAFHSSSALLAELPSYDICHMDTAFPCAISALHPLGTLSAPHPASTEHLTHIVPLRQNADALVPSQTSRVFSQSVSLPLGSVMPRVRCCPAGCAAIQIAKQVGATIYTTSSTKEKLDECKKLGADVLINYKEENFSEIVRSKANPDAVLEVRHWCWRKQHGLR